MEIKIANNLHQIFQGMLDCLLKFNVAIEKSNATLLLYPLIINYFFSPEIFRIFSLFLLFWHFFICFCFHLFFCFVFLGTSLVLSFWKLISFSLENNVIIIFMYIWFLFFVSRISLSERMQLRWWTSIFYFFPFIFFLFPWGVFQL